MQISSSFIAYSFICLQFCCWLQIHALSLLGLLSYNDINVQASSLTLPLGNQIHYVLAYQECNAEANDIAQQWSTKAGPNCHLWFPRPSNHCVRHQVCH